MRKNCNITLKDSVEGYLRNNSTVSLGRNYAPLASRPGFCSDTLDGQPLNTNGYMFGGQNFQTEHSQQAFLGENTGYDPHFLMLRGLSVLKSHQEYAPVDSPTLTTNSERSEITEVSTDFNFLGGSQQLVRGQQQFDTSQFHSMQQSTYNDMQLLQQQMMFKQVQDIHRQQQLQQFDDARQQGSQSQISAFTRQSTGAQYPSYINGTSIPDSSEMFMNRAHLGASSAAQGVYNQLMFSHEKGQSFHSSVLVPQQLDESNYRAPISSGRGSMGQYSQLQGIDRDRFLKPTMQPVFSSSSVGNVNTGSAGHFALPQMGRSRQGFQAKSLFDQIPNQGLDAGMRSDIIPQRTSLQANGSFAEFQGGQGGAGWLGSTQQKVTQLDASQYFVPLDPIEQKILYNMDHNMWDTSLGKCTNVSNGGFENNLVHSDFSDAFPSIQSGSWSALMQSAVAEASSSDTGIQEEWSGLTFQNTELSTENQHSNIVDSKKEQSAWYENSLHSASSLSSRPYANFNDSGMSSSFPGFQQSGIQPSLEQTEHLCPEDSHELNQNSSEKVVGWLDNKSAQKRIGGQSQHVQPHEHLNKSLTSQLYEQPEYDRPPQQIATSHDNVDQSHGKPQGRANEVSHNQRDYSDFRHLENMKHVNTSMNSEENDIMRKNNSQISDDPTVLQNTFDKAGDSFIDKLQQKGNYRDQYMSKQLSSQGQGHFQQSYLYDASSNDVNSGKFTGFQRNLKPSDGTPRGNLDASTNFFRSTGSNGRTPYNQTSENVNGHLQNVDQSKENSAISHYSPIGSSPLSMMAEAEFPNPSVSQHPNQSPSQGFPMRLLHPSQQLPYLNKVSSSQGLLQLSSTLDTRPVNSGFVEKNQTLLASSSPIQSMPPSQNVHWDEKSHCLGEAEAATSLFQPPHFVSDENQGQFASGAPAVRLSPQASLPSAASRYPQYGLSSSQDTSRHTNSNISGKQYPVFEALPISQPLSTSRLGQQGGLLARQQNVWLNNTFQQNNAYTEGNKIGSLNNTLEATSLVPLGINDQTSEKCGLQLLESDTIPTNSQDYDHKDEIPGQRTKSDVYNTLLADGVARKIASTNAFPSGLLLANPHQQDFNSVQIEGKNLAACEGDLAYDNFSKLPHVGQQYAPQKVKLMKNVEAEPKGVQDAQHVTIMSKENSAREDAKQGFASEMNSLPSENRKMLNLLAGGAREDYNVKFLSENPLNACSTGFTSDGQSEAVSEFNRKNMEGNNEENSQTSSLSASSWFKFRNEQLHAKHPGGHFSLLKPLDNFCKQSSLGGIDSSDVSLSGKVWSTAAKTTVATDLTVPYGLPSTVTVETGAILRPKKRKLDSSELQPWHLEIQGSQRIVNISVAEQDWAENTSRLTEKMVNEVEMIEDVMLRSKRRLIVTTQLLQQLVCPAPSSILSADASSVYDSVIYLILRASLGDTCSLMCGQTDFHVSTLDSRNVMSEDTVKCTDDKYIEKTMERFYGRAGKLESDLQRLDRTASIVDLMVECQDLERFSVINRFAKFHIRQAELSGNASSNGLVTLAPKSCPQRYVTVHPIPNHLPEGVQCVSL
ncbi:uncharacterized protein LOC101205434 isoform X1 [Cucumis sativus]|uniref:uncharacterized protein LOC101205434 isoform X1 n=1 Tax=Cucumis sativus TaxID=3659 RepID=UPI0012F5115D|nr:uncharacterized protein LOC101205434 isoform X1 [Cucumis sativus]XP_031742315.1 uncharacterized protein LOC101205434 isoform X1 [Cucumis sativus]